jgi:SAM-dependent methyltransferase
MKTIIRNIAPKYAITTYRKLRSILENRQNKTKSTEQVFSDIYLKNKWGGSQGEFSSGSGSREQAIVSPYINMIFEKANSEHFRDLTFLDLGCGDFQVGRQLLPLCSRYIGIDIVKPLIELHHKNFFGSENVQFRHMNMIDEKLPIADVCFIRQVLQHLSNDQISSVLPKLAKFKFVFITEHYPNDNDQIQPNIDKTHGGGVRLANNSGVYLTKPPFNLSEKQLSLALEVPGASLDDNTDPGVIRTFIYKPYS